MADLETRLAARPLYLQVRDVLVQRIVVGHWRPGATLPNETQLAQQLGISIGTVRKALDLMEMERIVTRRQGRGTFVNDFTSSETPLLFSAFYNFEGQSISVSPSIGIALFPRDGETTEALVKNADAAMYLAKERGRSNYQFFNKGLAAIRANGKYKEINDKYFTFDAYGE